MKQFFTLLLSAAFYMLSLVIPCTAFSQGTTLNANGPGNTYELINSVLAPGYTAVEAPDASHAAFGRHITEVFDSALNKYVFEFDLHLTPDNDPSTGSPDRQRVEIKTYDQSPANLIGTPGEVITYKWKFKIAAGFQPSSNFTHIHQIKPVDGDDATPIFTLTPRKGTVNKLELLHVDATGGSSVKVASADLSLFEDVWVEATEVIKVDSLAGIYSLVLKKVSDGTTLLSYSNNQIKTIRSDNSFIRPKWGIYRSLLTPSDLRDEAVRFSDFSITEGTASLLGTTYYWVGGTAVSSFTSNGNWNTQLNGGGVSRSVAGALPDDILIIDGSNIGGTTPTTGTVTTTVSSNAIGQLKLQNNANVVFQRVAAGGGTGTLTISGDAIAAPDFTVDAGSSLTINSPLADGNVVIDLNATATGLVGGTITLTNTGTHRITSQTAGGLVFTSGATFNSDGTPTSSAYAFGSSSQGVQYGVVFESGSNLIYSGTRSPFGGTSTYQAANMMPGSNFYVKTSNQTSTGSYTAQKVFGNVFVQNNSTFTADGAINKIENLTIDAGSSMIFHTSGNSPVLGNLLVNGSLSAPVGSTNVLVMGGNSLQTISGTGTINVPGFAVGNYSNVKLSKMITIANTANIVGKLDFGTNGQITGTATFTSRVAGSATSVTGNTTAGSYQVTGVVGALSGNTALAVTGTGIDAGTVVVGLSSSNAYLNLSKPALATATGVTLNFSSDSATLATANPSGMDTMTGSIIVSGLKSFNTGTNYVINGATTWPFGISSTASTSISPGDITLNAPVTTNYNVRVRGTLTLGSGNLTIRPLDTLRIISGNAIAGAPFSNSKYVVTALSGADNGVLRIDGFSTARTFPVGTATQYLPVTLTPTSDMNFAVSVFTGVTEDATPAGTPFSAAQKDKIADAVWRINRTAGTGDCNVQVSWPAALEGAAFAGFADNEIGIASNNGTSWDIVTGTGDNTLNTANGTFSSFYAFSVGQLGFILPMDFKGLSATAKKEGIDINWQVVNETALKNYVVEKSYNGIDFTEIGTVNAMHKSNYTLLDPSQLSGTFYYRIKMASLDGSVKYSKIVVVKPAGTAGISIYPNPVANNVFINGLNGKSSVRIVNAAGQILMQQSTGASTLGLDASNLKTGFYIIEVYTGNDLLTTKPFIKQ